MTFRSRPWWPWARRILSTGFFLLVAWLLYALGRQIEWRAVFTSLQGMPLRVIAGAVGLALLSYSLICSFDLLGRRYTGHTLRKPAVVLVNFISYAFNLNLGALVGGVAFRYRLYSRLGLGTGTITRVVTISMLTNWLGYALLTGALFLVWPLALPEGWEAEDFAMRLVGGAMLAIGLAYVAACVMWPGRTWHVRWRGTLHHLRLPSAGLALAQASMSMINWAAMGGVIWVLLRGQSTYHEVLSVLLVAAVAGVLTHVPAGLGVLEGVFIALLGGKVPQDALLAALLGYRAMYYVVPLLGAAIAFAATELRARQLRHRAPPPSGEKKPHPKVRPASAPVASSQKRTA